MNACLKSKAYICLQYIVLFSILMIIASYIDSENLFSPLLN